MNDIAQTNGIQIRYYNRENILRIFRSIDNATHQPGVCRKRLISVNFIIKQLFDILGVEYKIILLTRSKNTLQYYENWWESLFLNQAQYQPSDFSEFGPEVGKAPNRK